jgi:RimJ/RimL family protein N-acetyltransferase
MCHKTFSHISCVPFKPDDTLRYLSLFVENENFVYMDISCVSLQPRYDEVFAYLSNPYRFSWFIKFNDDDTYIGFVSVLLNRKHNTATLTCYITSLFQRLGYMKQALTYVQNKLIIDGSIIRIEAQVHCDNTPSIHFFERMGYVCEGRLRKNFVVDGVPGDSYMFSLLSDDVSSST